MKNKDSILVIISVLALVLLVSACTETTNSGTASGNNQQPQDTNVNPGQTGQQTNQTAETIPKKTITDIYRYASLKSFEYRTTSSVGGKQNILDMMFEIKADTVDGVDSWLEQITTKAGAQQFVSKMWLDKLNYKCFKYENIITFGGQTVSQLGDCPQDGPNAPDPSAKTALELGYVGKESVTVPAGTFNADKYTLKGVDYWVASDVPVPLKVSYGDGVTVMELVSYS